MGEEKGKKVLESIEKETFKSYDNPVIDKLRNLEPAILADFIKMEHPQTVAFILAHLRPEQIAEILESYPPEKQTDIAMRVATLKSVPCEFVDEITRVLESELILGGTGEQNLGGANIMAEVLNNMSGTSENAILEFLENTNPELATEIRNLTFTIDNVLELDDKSIREILREVSSEELARAIKVLDQDMMDKVLRNMSERAATMLMEDIEIMPPIRVSEVEQSQRTIIDIAKKLDAEGRIAISRGSEDEFV